MKNCKFNFDVIRICHYNEGANQYLNVSEFSTKTLKKIEKFDKVEFIITYENIISVGLSNNVSLMINICIKINQTQIQAFQFSCCRV